MWINLAPDELDLIKTVLRATLKNLPEAVALVDRLEEDQKNRMDPVNQLWAEKAGELHGSDGECEIDAQADGSFLVSESDDGGAYVMAWVWVSNEDMEACTECGAIPGTAEYGTVGDGYDGLCPSCADKYQEEDEDE